MCEEKRGKICLIKAETQLIVGLWTSFLTKNKRILHFLICAKGFIKPSDINYYEF